MERNLALELVRVTEAAALASSRWMGKGDGRDADHAACEAMAIAIKSVKIKGHIVFGERNPRSELSKGRIVGAGGPPEVDVAVDPLESINSVAMGRPNAISIIAVADKGSFFDSPVQYMNKIAVGPEAAGRIDIKASPLENLVNIADAKRTYVEDLTVCILDRERHKELIEKVRSTGARIQLIDDGDVSAAIAAATAGSGIDVLMGVGGASEGVLSAAALKCAGGDFQGQLHVTNDEDVAALKRVGFANKDQVLGIGTLVNGDRVLFAATGVTKSDILQGVQYRHGGAVTHSIVMRRRSGTIRVIQASHSFDRKPDYA
ncbi:MAG: class II fructose-bisphosphatase [Candidatus Krumholzibacteria bacterium]|nr:class II fructose-bisphosphatase [Candidatus Krumholzibacteria bacterium]